MCGKCGVWCRRGELREGVVVGRRWRGTEVPVGGGVVCGVRLG